MLLEGTGGLTRKEVGLKIILISKNNEKGKRLLRRNPGYILFFFRDSDTGQPWCATKVENGTK